MVIIESSIFKGTTQMKIRKAARQLAKDLGISEVDAYMMELKTKLYIKSSELIKGSELRHAEIAKLISVLESKPALAFAA